jgi:hypothetical protein
MRALCHRKGKYGCDAVVVITASASGTGASGPPCIKSQCFGKRRVIKTDLVVEESMHYKLEVSGRVEHEKWA